MVNFIASFDPMIVLFIEVLYYSNFIIGSWKEVWVSNIWVIDTYSVSSVCLHQQRFSGSRI